MSVAQPPRLARLLLKLVPLGDRRQEVTADLREAFLRRFEDKTRQFPYYSSPAVANGMVDIGGRDKNVRAIDLATGRPRWAFATRARVDSSPAIAGNRVAIGSSDGHLYVLDLASGKKIWEFDATAAILASPAIVDGKIVVGDMDGRLYAFGS